MFDRVLIGLLLFGWASVEAALRFESLDAPPGLTQRTVTAIAQDAQGFMWFGTQHGLNRYDGYEIIQYLPGRDQGLMAGYINDLLADPDGGLWVATDGGVQRFNSHTQTFASFPRMAGRTLVLAKDSAGTLWAGGEQGLFRFESGIFVPAGLNQRMVRDLAITPTGTAFVATHEGLWRGNITGGFERMGAAYLPPHLTALAWDPSGLLWVASNSGLYKLDSQGVLLDTYLQGHGVTRLLPAHDGTLWIGLDDGVAHLTGNGVMQQAHTNPARASSIGAGIIFSLFEGRNGIIWIGLHGNGVRQYVPAHNVFKVLRHRQDDPRGLTADVIMPILAEPDGRLWVGTYDSGLNLRRPGETEFVHFRHHEDQAGSLPSDHIRAIYRDGRGRLWIGTNDAGLARYDAEGGAFLHYPADPGNPSALQHSSVTALTEASGGRLWVGTWGGGLHLFDPNLGEVLKHFSHDPDDNDSLVNNRVMDLARDATGRLWVATRGGLERYQPDTAKFVHYQGADESGNVVESLAIAPDGTLWLGTRGGLAHFTPGTGEFRYYTSEDGLKNELVVGVLLDAQGKVWASTQAGLARLDPATGKIRHYGVADGLPGDEFNSFGFDSGPNGMLYFGGMEGVVAFHPAQLRIDSRVPPVRLTRLMVNNHRVNPKITESALLHLPIGFTNELELTHEHRMVTFQFAALDYASPAFTQYAYRLEGFNKRWVTTDARRRMATYTNLDPGRYVFRVKAAASNGSWGTNGNGLVLHVLPPPWLTWWAYLGYCLLGLFLVVGVFRYFLLRREKQHAEATTQMKSEFMAVLSHEIRNPLSVMLGSVDLIRQGSLNERQRNHADNLRHAGTALLSRVNDVLDYSREEAGHLHFECVPFRIRPLISELGSLYSVRAQEKGLKLAWHVDDEVPEALRGDPSRLRQVLLNLLGNAIKFTQTGEIHLNVTQRAQREDYCELRFEVQDSGPGITCEAQGRLFEPFSQADSTTARLYGGSGLGLSICKRLIEGQGGCIGIESKSGQGSTFWFELGFHAAAISAPATQAIERQIQPKRILVVEDIALNRRVVRELLESDGHQVAEAENGRVARQKVEDGDPFDVIFTDMHMPVEDGLTTTKRLRASDNPAIASVAIIALTGSAKPEQREACLSAGMDQVLVKPITLAMLREVLAALDTGEELPSSDLDVDAKQASAILDTAVVKAHAAALGTKRVTDIIELFDSSAHELLERLHGRLVASDAKGAQEVIHAFSGAASGLGCGALHDTLRAWEDRLHHEDPAIPLAEFSRLRQLLEETLTALRNQVAMDP